MIVLVTPSVRASGVIVAFKFKDVFAWTSLHQPLWCHSSDIVFSCDEPLKKLQRHSCHVFVRVSVHQSVCPYVHNFFLSPVCLEIIGSKRTQCCGQELLIWKYFLPAMHRRIYLRDRGAVAPPGRLKSSIVGTDLPLVGTGFE